MPAHDAQPAQPTGLSRAALWPAIILLNGFGLRLAASRGDLVFDEVWTWNVTSNIGSAADIPFLGHDNNHILNSLIMYALGPAVPPWAYRLPAVMAGSLALWFGYLLARREGSAPGLAVLILLSFSHPLIVFSTEARGYAYLACCTLAAWWALEEYLDRPRAWPLGGYVLASILGFFSHLTFAFAYSGFAVYSLARLLPRRGGLQKLVYLQVLPVLTCVFLYFAFVEKMGIGGGTEKELGETLLATCSLAAGGPERGLAAQIAAGIALVVTALSLAALVLRSPARGIFFLTVMLVGPALVVALRSNNVVYPRYFLVPLLFAYVAAGTALGRWFASTSSRRWGPALLLAAFTGANLVPVVRLIGAGRGQYEAALRWMAEHDDGQRMTVASDHDFRNPYMLDYYSRRAHDVYADLGKRIDYVTREKYLGTDQLPGVTTEWFLLHSFSGDPPHPPAITPPNRVRYALVKVFPCESLSGWTWWLYRRQEAATHD